MKIWIQDYKNMGCIFVIASSEADARVIMEYDYPDLYEVKTQVQEHVVAAGFSWANWGDR